MGDLTPPCEIGSVVNDTPQSGTFVKAQMFFAVAVP